jgi:hypothetical protein
MWCSDPFVNYLKEFGYSIVRLPRADIHPLEIYTERGGSLDYVGKLDTVFQAGDIVPLPKVSKNIPATNISGRRTSSINIGIGLTVLGSILGAMGGSQLGLDAHFRQAKAVMFEFHEVLQDKIEPAKLDQYLANASISPFSRGAAQFLESDEIYVTTATLKSKQLTVEARTTNDVPLELHVPSIQGVVGGNVSVSSQAEIASKLLFEGKDNLVFGFQAIQLFFLNGFYRAYEIVQPSGGMRRGETISSTVKMVESEGPFLRLHKHIDEVK